MGWTDNKQITEIESEHIGLLITIPMDCWGGEGQQAEGLSYKSPHWDVEKT